MNNKVSILIVAILSLSKTYAQTGIGISTPVNKFDIFASKADPANAGSAANGNLRLGAIGLNNHVLDFGLSSTSTYSWLQARDKTAYGTNYILALNPNGGYVGIGTSTPSTTLTIGNATGTVPGEILLNPTATVNEGGQITIKRSLTGSTVDWTIDQYGTTSANARLRIFNGASETNGMNILENGKIGFGTITPSTLLHVQNSNVFSGSDNPASNTVPSLYVYNANNTSTAAHAISLVRTAGTASGKPYYSLDVNGYFGYSFGINNPTDQLIINASWDFNTAAANNAIIINRSGQNRVIIPNSSGGYISDWPSGWGGGLSTYDITCGAIYYNGIVARSDRRLKNTIENLSNSLINSYLQLRPVTYYWNQDKPRDTKLQYGLIAQEVELLFPELVHTGSDNLQTKSINYQALHALSLKVIQSQQTEIESLKKKQLDMEQRLMKLEAKLNQ